MKTQIDNAPENSPLDGLEITETSKALFLDYARDAGNWGGTPLVGGNVGCGPQFRGNLTQLKKGDLVKTFQSDGLAWISFTDAGRLFALQNGIDLSLV